MLNKQWPSLSQPLPDHCHHQQLCCKAVLTIIACFWAVSSSNVDSRAVIGMIWSDLVPVRSEDFSKPWSDRLVGPVRPLTHGSQERYLNANLFCLSSGQVEG
ncbi:hypothetical protein VFPPC_17471 [Pochonia chlamydosporia 170]|uniref:Uncharacterized protein n=1 Tax=Pochonia chlamydosporia 170 TaxID=1380566 RepID=A0A219ARG7_METCM|nr:hypothetical protein VFPPC_17471 [Pochonia chlamydosporia 170]OWT43366.1 hypothetical protein VFPPC_17471 [Pochonia chlamydosporia 170]